MKDLERLSWWEPFSFNVADHGTCIWQEQCTRIFWLFVVFSIKIGMSCQGLPNVGKFQICRDLIHIRIRTVS
jgi:hypothetical protein